MLALIKKIVKSFILILLVGGIANSAISQTEELKTRGIEFALLYYNRPSLNVSYSKELIWPTAGTRVSSGIELIQVNDKIHFMLTGRFNGHFVQTKSGLFISIGFSILNYYNFIYEKTDTLANFGIKPEITLGYKNIELGYQRNYFVFDIEPKEIDRQSFVLYYRMRLWK